MTTQTLTPRWIKSSYSGNGGQCIEVATNMAAHDGTIPVRDSKQPSMSVVVVQASSFVVFVRAVKGGQI